MGAKAKNKVKQWSSASISLLRSSLSSCSLHGESSRSSNGAKPPPRSIRICPQPFTHLQDTRTWTRTHTHALSTLLHGLEELLQLHGEVQVALHLQPPAHVGTQGTQVTHQEVLQVFLCHLQNDVGAALGYATASLPAACRTRWVGEGETTGFRIQPLLLVLPLTGSGGLSWAR